MKAGLGVGAIARACVHEDPGAGCLDPSPSTRQLLRMHISGRGTGAHLRRRALGILHEIITYSIIIR